MMTLNCPYCDVPMEFGDTFCRECGNVFVEAECCQACGAALDESNNCQNCGQAICRSLTGTNPADADKGSDTFADAGDSPKAAPSPSGMVSREAQEGKTEPAQKPFLKTKNIPMASAALAIILLALAWFLFQKKDVYVAGAVEVVDGMPVKAVFWKNGKARELTGGSFDARACSIFVSGRNVFVVGYEENRQGKKVATVWKNGRAQRLSDGKSDSEALSVYVSGKNVYVAGYDGDSAVFWVNGAMEMLEGNELDSVLLPIGLKGVAKSIFVYGKDVYVSGNFFGTRLWKNGVLEEIKTNVGIPFLGDSVFVNEGDVYLAGNVSEDPDIIRKGGEPVSFIKPALWKNGVEQNINYKQTGELFYSSSVFVRGNDVYLAGRELSFDDDGMLSTIGEIVLLKNGIKQVLSPPRYIGNTTKSPMGTSGNIFVTGKKVYLAGTSRDSLGTPRATLWVNGNHHYQSDNISWANSVFVE